MPSVYTMQGAGGRKKKRGSSPKQKEHQRRFARAAKKCKGQPGAKFRACVRRELKK